MRYRKKEFWRRLALLDGVNRSFRKTGLQAEIPTVEELVQCQEVALEMGTCLESLGAIAEPVVVLLEAYCECLYQQSVRLDDPAACRQISKKIQKQLSQVTRMIQFDLPEGKKEIVFLPYKASMWDSLESVWLAARDDEDCEALVVSIPWYDKNPDGSFGELHDEKDQYPADVPVTDWREYSIPERRPDAIFIHNPYDNGNYVTSVHPSFYASELKRYTELLVYVPYFVGINDHVAEHFCVLPGTLYADRVIVESEAVRNIYLEAFRKFEQENRCQSRFGIPEQKFLALGSPKLDRVRSVRRENVSLPTGWERLMESEDGTRKKVILYNTTINSFLKYGETAIRKIRQVLQTLKETPSVVLLWRPHPLLLPTARSMRPGLAAELEQMMTEYREAGWGIYDDTPDVERAIALADAYYGDWSSVVTLCQAAGKPVMIQDYENC